MWRKIFRKGELGIPPAFLPRPLLRAGNQPKFWQILSPKNSFAKTSSVLKPHALPEYLEGRTPKEKHPFLFQKKFHPRQIRNARSVFSFGVAGVLARAWGFNADSAKRKSFFLGERIFRFTSTDFPPAGGVWGGMRAGFGLGVFVSAAEFRNKKSYDFIDKSSPNHFRYNKSYCPDSLILKNAVLISSLNGLSCCKAMP